MATKIIFVLSVSACLSPALATIAQAANFNVSASLAETYSCGPKCYQILMQTNVADLTSVGTDFDFSFYETAANVSTSKPGDLLKL